MQENSYVVQHINLMLYNMFFTTICGLQHSTALNDLLLRAVVIAYEVAALFGTQTLHWFAFREYFLWAGTPIPRQAIHIPMLSLRYP